MLNQEIKYGVTSMVFPLWILVILGCMFLTSYFYQIHVRNKFFRFLCNKGNIGWWQTSEWMQTLIDRQKELEQKDKFYFRLIFDEKWIGSRLWRMWKDKKIKLENAVLYSKIFFGTDLKTPVEFGIDEVEDYLRDYLSVENEINYWINRDEKDLLGKVQEGLNEFDIEAIKACYSKEEAKYILDKVFEIRYTKNKDNLH